jgi:Flp pilus assembly pilin Flp
MFNVKRSKKITGQTALEYALVIGVIAVGVITAAKYIFGDKGAARDLMQQAVQEATDTIKPGDGT